MARRTNTTSAHCRLIAIDGTIHSLKAIPTSKAMHPSREVGCFDNGESLVAVGVIAVVRAICPSPFFSSAALRRRKKTDPQHGPCSCQSWPRRHEADGGQEELDGRWVSLPSGLPGGDVTCSYRAFVRASHRISSYSYSVRRGGRYSVKRYSYSMAVRTAAAPSSDLAADDSGHRH